jgi:biopolymer transport protein ExbB
MKSLYFKLLAPAFIALCTFGMAEDEAVETPEQVAEQVEGNYEEELAVFEQELASDPVEVSVVEPMQASAPPPHCPVGEGCPEPAALAEAALPPSESESSAPLTEEKAVERPVIQADQDEPLGAIPAAFQLEEIQPLVSEVTAQESESSPHFAPEAQTDFPFLSKNEEIAAQENQEFAFQIDLKQVFAGAPIIYSLLICMSIGAISIWLYNMLHLRQAGALSETLLKQLRNKLNSNQYEDALSLCLQNNNFFCKILASGIATRSKGLHIMLEAMKSEGQRSTVIFWQRLALLNDIAVIAPMFGLLGTVIGMFYAFYDIHRSMKSIATFFDGLGISVGTTVAGLIVAIVALILHSIAKYRLVRHLAYIENEAQSLATLIDGRSLSSDKN